MTKAELQAFVYALRVCGKHTCCPAQKATDRAADAIEALLEKNEELWCQLVVEGVEGRSLIEEEPPKETQTVSCASCAVPHNKYTGCPKLGGLVTTPDFFCAEYEQKGVDEWQN